MIYGWSPGIGDPDALGWFTVAAYLIAAALCYAARARTVSMTRSHQVWGVLVVLLVAMAINKQLDLQSLGTAIARHLAYDEGWYSNRRNVQKVFIFAIGASAMFVAIGVAVIARGADRWAITGLGGLILLIGFVLIRAASFHHIDAIIGRDFVGVRVNHLLELGGISIIGVSALGSSLIGSGTIRVQRRPLDLPPEGV